MITQKHLLTCLIFALLALGCSKEKMAAEEDQMAAERAGREYLLAENTFENIFKIVTTQARQQGSLNGFKSPESDLETRGNCPESDLSLSDNSLFPATLELNFGEGCSDDGSPLISGKITAVFDGLLLSPGTSINLSFSDFVHAGNAVSGAYEIKNEGKDANEQLTFSSSIDGQLTTAAGKTISYQAATSSKQTEGGDTNFFNNGLEGILDDVWSTTREAVLTTSDGLVANVSTPSAIQHPIICKWPVSGLFALDLNDPEVTGMIDFGDGSCDDKALLTIGDNTVEIDLQ